MRVGFPGGPRLEWYDRNPLPQEFEYAGQVGPHSVIDRITYTVPSGKKFFLENAEVLIMRDTAPTAEGLAQALIMARGYRLIIADILSATINDKSSMNVGRSIIMRAGEIIKIATADISTEGSHRYDCSFHGIEFSA